MRGLHLGLGLNRAGGGGNDPYAAYAANGFTPGLIYDGPGDTYVDPAGNTAIYDSSESARTGLATMVDGGVLKWNAHNLALNSASPATQGITVVSGADYTVEITGSGSVTLSGAGTGTVTAGNPVEITASTTTLTLTVSGSPTTMWAYRSDLGGMVNNPETGTTYVPTSGSAVYLTRWGAEVYDGEWVQSVGLFEPQATNLFTYSELFSNAAWTKISAASFSADTTGPDGETSAMTFQDDNGGGTGGVQLRQSVTVATSTTYTASIFAKADQLSHILVFANGFTSPANGGYVFDLSDGTSAAYTGTSGITATSENFGNGWWRVAITFTTDVSDTSGLIIFYLSDGSTSSFSVDNDGTSSVKVFGAQFEAGSVPTSYTPTNGSTVTRTPDTNGLIIPYESLDLGGVMPDAVSDQLQFYISYADNGSATEATLFDWRADANNRITVTLDTSSTNTGVITLTMVNGGSSASVSTTAELTPGVDVAANIAWRCTDSDINIALNGTAETATVTAIGVPDLYTTNIHIASSAIAAIPKHLGWLVNIADAGLEEASA